MAKMPAPHDDHDQVAEAIEAGRDKENMNSNSKDDDDDDNDDVGPRTSLQDVREAEISYLQSAILYQLVRSIHQLID